LFYHINNRNWRATILRCQTHPHEASYTDRWENTALHIACRFGAHNAVPLDVILILLDVCSTNAQNVDGCTPLHLACSHRSSADVIHALLEASRREIATRPSQSISAFKLHHSSQCMDDYDDDEALVEVESFSKKETNTPKSAAAILTKSGKTPLHYACGSFRHLCIKAFRILLEATYKDSGSSDILLQKDDKGDTPLSLLQKRYSERIRQAIELIKNSGNLNQNQRDFIGPANDRVNVSEIENTLGEFWEKASMILQTSYHGFNHTSSPKLDNTQDSPEEDYEYKNMKKKLRWRIVHASIGIGSKCPKPVVMLALTTYPEQVRECDEHGNFPLHIAALCEQSHDGIFDDANYHSDREPTNEEQRHHEQLENYCANFNLIKSLLHIFPQAAKLPNIDGHLPFALAVDYGNWMWGEELKTLLMAFPAAIECLDLDDKCFPYLLCLVGRKEGTHPSSTNSAIESKPSRMNKSPKLREEYTNLFYNLVRERPLIVKYGMSKIGFEEN